MYVNQKKFSRTYRASFDEIFRFTQGLALQLRGCVDSFDAIFDQTAGSEVPMVRLASTASFISDFDPPS